MPAEQFLPPGKLEAAPVMDATFGSPRLTQTRNQHSSVRCGHIIISWHAPGGALIFYKRKICDFDLLAPDNMMLRIGGTPWPSPVMAAEQFLPPGKLEVVSVMDATFVSPRLMQSRNQHCHVRARLDRPTLARRAPSDRLAAAALLQRPLRD